ncbi:MAG: methyltransferase domain-containing protein [Candidatus Aenigmarchaeota archaeon]|nr:methyltransferase domain-containing protein [Candidatus Aenigmarchaeota archaeon]
MRLGNFEIMIPEFIMIIFISVLFLPLAIYIILAALVDFFIRNHYIKKRKWDLNISCGDTDGGGINADIIERKVKKFVLVNNIYKLPFRNKQFENVLCSHTIEHVENPDLFYRELRRVSKNVFIVIPPLWDVFSILHFREHKWQFLSLRHIHMNSIPRRVRLPYCRFQKLFGQRVV